MLGTAILDPERVEADVSETAGLGLLDVVTEFAPEKQTVRVEGEAGGGAGVFAELAGCRFHGYEIHHGVTHRGAAPGWLRVFRRANDEVETEDGAIRPDGLVAGCYIHGLFDADAFRGALISALAARRGRVSTAAVFSREAAFERLAVHVRRHLDLAAVRRIAGLG
ncbi:MAG: hypothetical protein KatS3mg060_2753 [Dehalococcoidia bacterium]|nr:MAG: hypothetical protein KatS3mg060_2753 [Dehalococcoidia bacterium]